jgi:hypothetical protein
MLISAITAIYHTPIYHTHIVLPSKFKLHKGFNLFRCKTVQYCTIHESEIGFNPVQYVSLGVHARGAGSPVSTAKNNKRESEKEVGRRKKEQEGTNIENFPPGHIRSRVI